MEFLEFGEKPPEKEKPRALSHDLGRQEESRGAEEGDKPLSVSTVSGSEPSCNSQEGLSGQGAIDLANLLTPYHRKAAHSLAENVASLVVSAGLNNIGFLTLTFPNNITDHKTAYSRFNSFNSHFLSPHPSFGDWLCAKERQKRGAWHYHLLIDCGADIRTGVDFAAFAAGDYRTACAFLRSLWADLRESLPKYGFGRHELLPVRSNPEAMGRYLGKYISKHIDARKREDRGVRLISYSKKWSRSNTNFQWHTENSLIWRRGVQKLAEFFGCESLDGLKDMLGPKWAYFYREHIAKNEVPFPEEQKMEIREYFSSFSECRRLFEARKKEVRKDKRIFSEHFTSDQVKEWIEKQNPEYNETDQTNNQF